MGGTAGYEALTVGCRTLFVNSNLSSYDQILPKNVILDEIHELKNILEKIQYSRVKLLNTNIGKMDLLN